VEPGITALVVVTFVVTFAVTCTSTCAGTFVAGGDRDTPF